MIFNLLLKVGDIESNPGPNPEPSASDLLKAIKEVQTRQLGMLGELKSIRSSLLDYEKTLTEANNRLYKIEADYALFSSIKLEAEDIKSTTAQFKADIAKLTARMDDAENRGRRNNLVFYGLKDERIELWKDS